MISLCMIVRDEAAMLPRFLEAARGAWDELVAVDTGSTDGTVAILEAAGARVVHEPWRDDFAAARNAGLAVASGDWVLVLDADEIAPPELAPALREAAADASVGAATVLVRNPLPHGHVHEARLLRAFRRDPAMRFRHPIHEEIATDVAAFLTRHDLRLVHLPGIVEHLGYVRNHAAARGKKERDVRLLEQCIAVDPRDLYSRFKLLEQARFWADRALWRRAAADAERAMVLDLETLAAAPYGGELAALVAEGLHAGDAPGIIACLDRWEPHVRPSAPLLLMRGNMREALGMETAAEDFQRCLALAGQTADVQAATVRPTAGLARLAMAHGRFDEARARFEEALQQAPRDPESLLGALVLHRLRGGKAAVLAFAAAHQHQHGESVELTTAVGEDALFAGELELAAGLLAKAAGDPPTGRPAMLLAQALFALGRFAKAREAAASSEEPEAAVGILLCDLAETGSSTAQPDLDPREVDRVVRSWIAAAQRGGRPEVLAAVQRAVAGLSG